MGQVAKRTLQWIGAVLAIVVLVYTNRATLLTFVIDTIGLSDPFVGLTTDGKPRPDLFRIEQTGVSTEPVRRAAVSFLSSLDQRQRDAASFAVDDDEWRRWMNIHLYDRRGVGFLDMSSAQKAAGYGLLEASLSPRGYRQARNIMRLDTTLGELRGDDFEWYGEERFWLTLMGQPDPAKPWGWQIDGHHLVINYFVLGDQVVMSPVFLGAEPVVAPSGRHAGVSVLQVEQAKGVAMINALSDAQRQRAILSPSKVGNNAEAEFYSDNVVVPYAGVSVSTFDDAQKEQFLDLVDSFIGHMSEGHAEVKMAEIERHLDETYFAWVGDTSSEAVFYFRVHSPVIYIEFDHQGAIGLRHLAETDGPQRNHIHVVIRTPNGNDYGKDLLRQHLADHPH